MEEREEQLGERVAAKCKECDNTNLVTTSVPGLIRCVECGLVQAGWCDPAPDADKEEFDLGGYTVPDEIAVEFGWRAWGVDPYTPEVKVPVLRSRTHDHAFWIPGVPMEARCEKIELARSPEIRRDLLKKLGPPPHPGTCRCGLYSAKSYEHLMSLKRYHHYDEESDGLITVIGKVKVWGKVEEGTQGWRAQYGYPVSLFLPFEVWKLAPRLEEAYGLKVQLRNVLAEQPMDEKEA